MLVLARRVQQSIFIGPDIKITVTEIDVARGIVRIGIAAPQNLDIVREEISNVEWKKNKTETKV